MTLQWVMQFLVTYSVAVFIALATDDLDELACGAQTVFHFAAVRGVRHSWSDRFPNHSVVAEIACDEH